LLREFDNIVPGAASRIIAMAEAEQQHTHRMDLEVISKTHSERRLGQCAGFLLAVLFLGGAVYCASIGQAKVAMMLGGGTVLGLVSAFVLGRKFGSTTERASKNALPPE
jgi:uncharacterized membrane protein